jgi:hypothetical protein
MLLPVVSFAQPSATAMKFEYVFDIGGEPGFAIIQDQDGFLWFSSFYNGMLRFDGSSKWMIREGPDGISNDFVTQLFEDRNGHIWAGTNHGLNRYDKRSNATTLRIRTVSRLLPPCASFAIAIILRSTGLPPGVVGWISLAAGMNPLLTTSTTRMICRV